MENWTTAEWSAIKAWLQLALSVLVVVVWLMIVIQRGLDLTLDDVIRLITILYFGSTGASNIGKLVAYRNGV